MNRSVFFFYVLDMVSVGDVDTIKRGRGGQEVNEEKGKEAPNSTGEKEK